MVAPLALWVTPVSEPGGVARHVLDAARAGIPGYRLAVLCPEGWLADQLREVGAAVLTGPFGPQARDSRGCRIPAPGSRPAVPADDDAAPPRALGTVRAAAASSATLRHAVQTLRPALVHTHLAYADLIGVEVLRGQLGRCRTGGAHDGPALVSTEHGIAGDPGLYHGSAAAARAMARMHTCRLRRTDLSIAVSQATAEAMRRRWDARDVVVVRNGVDRTTAHQREVHPAAPLRLLSLSRLAPEKGLDLLLRSLAVLRREHPDAHLTLAGEGPERDRLRDEIRRLGLEGAVTLPGHLPATEALADHDVVVQLSRWENCSYTLLDAAAAGLGVVATDVGGNGEILPPRCLVPLDAPDLSARVAGLVLRQAEPGQRPTLPAEWPTPERTTGAVAERYDRLLRGTDARPADPHRHAAHRVRDTMPPRHEEHP